MPLRLKIGLVIGVVMFGLGAFLALRPLWDPVPKTGSRFLDLTFAIFFLVKGALYLRQPWRRTDRNGSRRIGTETATDEREGTSPSDPRP
jgi:hypothetical protein